MGQLAFLKLFILVAINEQITRTFNGEKTISIKIEKLTMEDAFFIMIRFGFIPRCS